MKHCAANDGAVTASCQMNFYLSFGTVKVSLNLQPDNLTGSAE